jgi:hypothetical protein
MGCCPSLSRGIAEPVPRIDRPVPIQEIPKPGSSTLEFVDNRDDPELLDDAPPLNEPAAPLSTEAIPMVQEPADDDNIEKLLLEVEGLSD